MPRYCPYCGNPLKSGDKFCIICGKPVLTDVKKIKTKEGPKTQQVEKAKDVLKRKVREIKGEEEAPEIEIIEEPLEEPAEEFVEETKKKKKSKKKKEEEKVEKPLPFEVKEQMILYIEYNDIQLNKTLLVGKLKEIQKSLKDPRYDVEEQFKKSTNIKINAIKTLIDELKQKENDVKQKMEEPFIVQKIKDEIEKRIFQLKNLTKEYKLHKIDKKTFESLREKYKQEKEDLEQQKEDLMAGIKLWISELKIEKSELKAERNLNKGRFSAKEIDEEDYKQKDKEFEIKIQKIESKISTLEDLIH